MQGLSGRELADPGRQLLPVHESGSAASPTSTAKLKVDPRPAVLSTLSSLPIAATSRRVMARPKPVPP